MKLKTDNRPQITVAGGAYAEVEQSADSPENSSGSPAHGDSGMTPGGPAACAAVALSRLRCKVYFVSCLGSDPSSGVILNSLQRQGVNLDYVERSKDEPTGTIRYEASIKGPARRIYSRGAAMQLTQRAVNRAGIAFSVSDIIILTPDMPRDTFHYSLRAARHFRAPSLVSVEGGGLTQQDVAMCDIISPDAAAAAELCGKEIRSPGDARRCAARLLQLGAGAVALFLGDKGVFTATSPDEPNYIPVTTGLRASHRYAKSAFDAGLAWALTLGYKFPEAAWIGASCSTAIRPGVQNTFEALPLIEDLVESQSLDIF